MSFSSFILARRLKLAKASHKVKISRNNIIKTRDGISLLTDIYFPQGEENFPTILIRTPYLRKAFANFASLYAERGFIVVLQATRGTDGSGGNIDPLINERDDGLATLEWIKKQKWFDGRLGMTGPSYLGYVQWAICDKLPKNSALSIQIATSNYRQTLFPQGAVNLQLWLSWMQLIRALQNSPLIFAIRALLGLVEKRTEKAALTIPLIEADKIATGKEISFWRKWIDEDINSKDHWQNITHTKRIGKNTPPVFLISGWYDFMIDELISDYQRLLLKGQKPYLTIGSWFHMSPALFDEAARSTIFWMQAQLKNNKVNLREKPVRIFISGLNKWYEFDIFPPKPINMHKLFLTKIEQNEQMEIERKKLKIAPNKQKNMINSAGKLSIHAAQNNSEPTIYRYDPNNPTPNLGGAIFAFSGAGARNNRSLETRKDVIYFTSEKLEKAIIILGQVRVKLFARSNLENTDFFVRLCDVDKAGRSINICDGFVRITAQTHQKNKDNIWEININLHHQAHQFKKGHRLRLLIASGATPKYSRNPGTKDFLLNSAKMLVANQEIFHNKNYPSSIILPVFELDNQA